MIYSEESWQEYIRRLSALNQTAGQLMAQYIQRNGTADSEALIRYAWALATKYGEGSAELACQMYDAAAIAADMQLPPAEPAPTAGRQEVQAMVENALQSPPLLQSGVSRLVRQAAADTTLQNAARDGAQFAWVPYGDSCPFCITLASRGWQRMGKEARKGVHAPHIHANCDCEYAVRFDESTTVAGYDPDRYLAQYNAAGGDLNAMRRAQYAENRDRINAQKRAAYAARKELQSKKDSGIIDKEVPNSLRHEFASLETLQEHCQKHSAEFGGISESEYVQKANALANELESDDVASLKRSDGSTSKYRFSTNEFVVINEDGTLRTYFKPVKGAEYWKDEIERN